MKNSKRPHFFEVFQPDASSEGLVISSSLSYFVFYCQFCFFAFPHCSPSRTINQGYCTVIYAQRFSRKNVRNLSVYFVVLGRKSIGSRLDVSLRPKHVHRGGKKKSKETEMLVILGMCGHGCLLLHCIFCICVRLKSCSCIFEIHFHVGEWQNDKAGHLQKVRRMKQRAIYDWFQERF